MKFSKRTQLTVIVCLVSGIASGLLFSIEPLLVPGAVFGLLFALVNLDKKLRIIPYVIASSGIYYIALQIAVRVGNISASDINSSSELSLIIGFLVAGLFGALALAILTQLLSSLPVRFAATASTTIVGAVAGLVFYLSIRFLSADSGTSLLPVLIGYSVWQVAVGWSLTASLQKQSMK
jgi:hypothetical protein